VQAGGGLTYTRAYNNMGRVTSSSQLTGGTTYSMSYGYNYAGAETSFTYPLTGRQETISYDTANRVSGVSGTYKSAGTTYAGTFAYFPNGHSAA